MHAMSHGELPLPFHYQGTKGTKKEAAPESNSKKFLNLPVSGSAFAKASADKLCFLVSSF